MTACKATAIFVSNMPHERLDSRHSDW